MRYSSRAKNWIRETIKWRTARRRLKISVGVAGPSASKLADVICSMSDNLNRIVTEEEIQVVAGVLKARLKPIVYPEAHTVRIKPGIISWEAAEAARNRPRNDDEPTGWTPTPNKLSIGNRRAIVKPKAMLTLGNGIRVRLK